MILLLDALDLGWSHRCDSDAFGFGPVPEEKETIRETQQKHSLYIRLLRGAGSSVRLLRGSRFEGDSRPVDPGLPEGPRAEAACPFDRACLNMTYQPVQRPKGDRPPESQTSWSIAIS
jgi:hypothetical protein